jgi:glycosyltransferase involved in cell wall biosynthesis
LSGMNEINANANGGLSLCVLIPAFNEEKTISKVVQGCRQYVRDVIVVDDGSSDRTGDLAREAGATVITHDVNRGKGAGLKTGFDYILAGKWDGLIVVDADGQHDWNEIPKIIKTTMDDNAGITIGSRMSNVKRMPIHRKASNMLTSWIISKLAGQYVPDSQCGFRLIRSIILRELSLSTDNFEMESEMIIIAARKGFKISYVPIRTIYIEGRSRIGPGRDTWKFIRLFAAYIFRFR